MKYYTYVHYTKDTKELFYVGKGSNKRAYKTDNRNRWWHNKVNKHGGFDVEILSYWETEKEALEHEKFIIDCLERVNILLVNISKAFGKEQGGMKLSKETRKRMSKARVEKWNSLTKEEKQEFISKISESNKGRKFSEQHRKNISLSRTGMKIPTLWKPIKCLTTGVVYPSLTEASKDTGCDPSHIVKCCKGKIKKIHNMEFAYD
jgi:hypothetical protein